MRILTSIMLLFCIFSPAFIFAEEPAGSQQVNTSGQPTVLFQLKFIHPQDIADQIREFMGAAPGAVIIHEQTDQLEVTADESVLESIKALITQLDRQRKIDLEIKVLQVDLNDEHRAGIQWSAIVTDFKKFIASKDTREFSLGTVLQEDYKILLEALETVGETRTFKFKDLLIQSEQVIDLRIKAYDQNVTVAAVPLIANNSGVPENQDRYSARLLISPRAYRDDIVDVQFVTDNSPVTAHVNKDSLIVIGGIVSQAKIESTKKFPFLGDLPVFGVVFRDQSRVVHRLENILFITPHVSVMDNSSGLTGKKPLTP